MKKEKAVLLTNGMLDTMNAKTAHGLLRGSERFEILVVIDYKFAGSDAGELMDGSPIGIPVLGSIQEFVQADLPKATYCVVGVALEGGLLPDDFRGILYEAMEQGLSLVCGLHTLMSEDPEFQKRAKAYEVQLIDVRKPKKFSDLHFWTGAIHQVKAPRIAVLGTDCAVGKRTTCRFLMETCQAKGLQAEMIYTGQTGWMQGHQYGFILDSTLNDFVSGELERAIVDCDTALQPDIIFIEGQSSLRNPSGPCGAEILLSAAVNGVVLQHKANRTYFDDLPTWGKLPTLAEEIKLIEAYGVPVLAVTLNGTGMSELALKAFQAEQQQLLTIPVFCPLLGEMEELTEVVLRNIV